MDRRQELSANQQHSDVASSSRPLAPSGWRDVASVRPDSAVHGGHPTATRAYNGITANDNSRFHAGDVYNYNSYLGSTNTELDPDSPETKLRNLRSALSYPQMGLRSAIVEDAYSDTCQWLFSTPEYQRWRDPTLYPGHHGFLWIKGKPGSGKSTAMKTLLSSAESARDRTGHMVLSYFFNARGEVLERSTEGLYRSLLHQITADVASLPEDVTRWSNPDSLELFRREGWQVDLLKGLLKKIVLLDRKCHLSCFIDALDEGDDEHSVRDMVEFLEDLTRIARDQQIHFSVCLASRHYPNITINRLEELQLDDHEEHLKDIDIYIRSKTKVFSTGLSDELVASIKHRSSGVFLWVVLVIAKLKRHADHGNEHKLQALLNSVPVGVERLLDDTLKKAGHDQCLVATLQWALLSTRPLRLQEFHTAVMLSNEELQAGAMYWDKSITEGSTKKFIVSASKGLLEIVASDRVQFVHESVREYFLRSGLEQIDRSLESNPIGISHQRLACWCRKYVQLTKFVQAVQSSINPNEDWRRARKAFPLLKYAMGSILRHAEKAAAYGIQLQAFDEAYSLENHLMKSRTWFFFGGRSNASPPPSALHILIYEGYNYLADIELSRYQGSPPKGYLNHLTIDALGQLSTEEKHIGCFTKRCSSPGERAGGVCKSASCCIGGPLHIAARKNAVDIALALIKSGVSVNDHCKTRGSALSIALRNSNEDRLGMVETLLRHGADPNQKDAEQITPLQMTIRDGQPVMLQVLLKWGADANTMFASCDTGCNPLILAARLSNRDQDNAFNDAMYLLTKNEYGLAPKGSSLTRFSPYSCNMLDVLEILLAHDAAADAGCKRCGMTAVDVVVNAKNWGAEEILRRYGATRHSLGQPHS